ncbi:hypothetical protein GCM10011339_11380 [Echinicola rosea]|uniref:Uncharacterized protein n=1 Tax=Echinicola rosea TaxID=1807691 RepID=A0ABQ1USA1_9BACT|nr:hypothetical protein GCM10011339_11380 [Echinicola rosea]
MGGFSSPSVPEEITEIIHEAATDNKDQLRYLVGENAHDRCARRLEIVPEAFRKEI